MQFKSFIIGTILGFVLYMYANRESNGKYNLGLSTFEETVFGLIYGYSALMTNEFLSTILLQLISSLHIISVLHKKFVKV